MGHDNITDIYTYMKVFSRELGERILQDYPALQEFQDPVSPLMKQLLRLPFPAQSIAIMGISKRWREWKTAAIVAECGTGKTLMSLGAPSTACLTPRHRAIEMIDYFDSEEECPFCAGAITGTNTHRHLNSSSCFFIYRGRGVCISSIARPMVLTLTKEDLR